MWKLLFLAVVAVVSGAAYAYEGYRFAEMVFDWPGKCVPLMSCRFSSYMEGNYARYILAQAIVVSVLQAIAIMSGVVIWWMNVIPGALIVFALPLAALALMFASVVGIFFMFTPMFWVMALAFGGVALAGVLPLLVAPWLAERYL